VALGQKVNKEIKKKKKKTYQYQSKKLKKASFKKI
jgi:hypothetical protein